MSVESNVDIRFLFAVRYSATRLCAETVRKWGLDIDAGACSRNLVSVLLLAL